MNRKSLKTHLVGGLIQLLGIERGANSEGDAGAEKDVVRDSGDAAIVDLGLFGARQQLLSLSRPLNLLTPISPNNKDKP